MDFGSIFILILWNMDLALILFLILYTLDFFPYFHHNAIDYGFWPNVHSNMDFGSIFILILYTMHFA